MCTYPGARGENASRASRRVASDLRTSWLLLLGFLYAASASPTPFAFQHESSVAWVTPIAPASRGIYRFALCPDDATVVFAAPGRLYRIDANGEIVATALASDTPDPRSLDCADVVRLMSVTPDRAMQLIEFEPQSLAEVRRVRLDADDGMIAHGIRAFGGIPHLVHPGIDGPLLAPMVGDAIGVGFGVRLERVGRPSPVVISFVPVFYRESSRRFVSLQTGSYSVVELDEAGRLIGTWQRDDPDFGRVHAPLVPGHYQREAYISGAALAPDGRLAVQVVKRRADHFESYVEVLSPTYELLATWVPPRKGTLVGWDSEGRLRFGYANVSSGSNVWTARPGVL